MEQLDDGIWQDNSANEQAKARTESALSR